MPIFMDKKVKVKESEVAQLCPSLCDPMNYNLQGSSFHGIFQARILECFSFKFGNKKYVFLVLCVLLVIFSTS